MNELSRLILKRKAELDLTWDDIAERGGFSSHTIAHALAHKKEHRQTPRIETLERLAKALELPLDVVKMAAAEAAGFKFEEIGTTLEAASDVRIIVAYMNDLSPRDRAKILRIAKEFADESNGDAAEG